MIRLSPTFVLLAAGTLAACAPPASRMAQGGRDRPSAAVTAACRQEVDRVYSAQNRRDLSYRDQRDTPFSDSYNSGVTSRGLSSLYDQDNMMASCVRNAENGAASSNSTPGAKTTGPVFSPANRTPTVP